MLISSKKFSLKKHLEHCLIKYLDTLTSHVDPQSSHSRRMCESAEILLSTDSWALPSDF